MRPIRFTPLRAALIAVAALLMACGCGGGHDRFETLSADDFARLISDNDVVLLDVRTAHEYAESHIHGAVNIDVEQDDFEQQALATLPHGQSVAVYCKGGVRSRRAAAILARQHYHVANLDSGLVGWQRSGFEVWKP